MLLLNKKLTDLFKELTNSDSDQKEVRSNTLLKKLYLP